MAETPGYLTNFTLQDGKPIPMKPIALSIILLMITSCGAGTPQKQGEIAAGQSCLYGKFRVEKYQADPGESVILVIRDTKRNEEILLPLTDGIHLQPLEPGEYIVQEVDYVDSSGYILAQRKVRLLNRIRVAPGTCHYIGDYHIYVKRRNLTGAEIKAAPNFIRRGCLYGLALFSGTEYSYNCQILEEKDRYEATTRELKARYKSARSRFINSVKDQ